MLPKNNYTARSLPDPKKHNPARRAGRDSKSDTDCRRESTQIIRGGKARDLPCKSNRPDGGAAEQQSPQMANKSERKALGPQHGHGDGAEPKKNPAGRDRNEALRE